MNIVEKFLCATMYQQLEIKLKLVRLEGNNLVKAGLQSENSLVEITFYDQGKEINRYVSEAKIGLS